LNQTGEQKRSYAFRKTPRTRQARQGKRAQNTPTAKFLPFFLKTILFKIFPCKTQRREIFAPLCFIGYI
jgi:hypothetical protein